MPVAFDFNEVPGPSAAEIKANGGKGALTYGTGAQQSPDYIASLEAVGLHTCEIWEHNEDSILGGYAYGVQECRDWEATHPPGLVYLACDLNDGRLGDASVEPFCRGWGDTTREPCFGLYGPDRAWLQVKGFVAKCQRMWGVINWLENGYPNNDQRNIDRWVELGAHLLQMIGSPIDNTDQDLILQDNWWTTGSPQPPVRQEDDVILYATSDDNVNWTYYRDAGGILVKLHPSEVGVYYGGMIEGWVHVVKLGGTLAALAFNANTKAAKIQVGV